jgi:GNAT superfamily N-acetyltransferase
LKYKLAVEELRRRKSELIEQLRLDVKIVPINIKGNYKVTLPKELGFAEFHLSESGLLTIRRIRIGPHIKESSLRNLGLGKLIIEKIISFARANGVTHIGLYSAYSTIDFYKHLGFKKATQDSCYMYLKL